MKGEGPAFCYETGATFCRRACKPDSVEDGHSSWRRITALAPATYPKVSAPSRRTVMESPRWRTGPARIAAFLGRTAISSLFDLAPCGVYPASAVTAGAVRSYRTFSPLPAPLRTQAVFSLWHWPSRGLYAPVPDVIRHTALRSPDFPPPTNGEPREAAIVQPPARSIVR